MGGIGISCRKGTKTYKNGISSQQQLLKKRGKGRIGRKRTVSEKSEKEKGNYKT